MALGSQNRLGSRGRLSHHWFLLASTFFIILYHFTWQTGQSVLNVISKTSSNTLP